MKKVFLFLVLGLICTIGMISCGEDDKVGGDVALTSITVNPPTLSLVEGGQQQVTATAVPKEATGVSFKWSSSDEDVATVSQNGIVVAKAVGTATITVESGNVKETVPVTVTAEVIPLVSISVNRPKITKAVDDTAQVIVSATPPNASGVTYTWASANKDVATVDTTGIITIKGVGTTTITVSGTGTEGSATTPIEVIGTIKGLTVTDENGKTSEVIFPGNSINLVATFDPEDAEVTPEWSSSDDAIATVDQTGFVRVVGLGTALITAKIGEYSAVYAVSTESPFDNAKGWWTFDDPDDLGHALIGEDLVINSAVVNKVDGPTETNGAVRGAWTTSPDPDVENIRWDHSLTGQYDGAYGTEGRVLWNYTVLMDLKVLFQDDEAAAVGSGLRNVWQPLMSVGVGTRAGLYIAWADWGEGSGDGMGLGVNITGSWQFLIRDKTRTEINPEIVNNNEKWYRLVFKMTYTPEESRHKVYVFLDGYANTTDEKHTYPAHDVTDGYCVPELEIREGKPVYFMTTRKHDKRHQGQYDLANLVVWDYALSDEEILALGAAVPK